MWGGIGVRHFIFNDVGLKWTGESLIDTDV